MQPQAAGSGWGAPGRATVQLGNAIGSLGDALGDIAGSVDKNAIAEQDFNDKMLMLKTDNEMGLNQIETQSTYSGTGDDYLPQRSEYYDTTTGGAISQMQPRNQQKAALFFEQRRGPYLERDATFGGKRRQDTLSTTINDAISTEYGKLATAPSEEFEDRFRQTIQATDAIISNAPLPDKLKDQIAGQAAERGLQIIQGLAEDPETAPEIIPKVLRMIEEPQNEIQGGALQSEPVPSEPLPEVPQGAEGVQGLEGSPSGPAATKPLQTGDLSSIKPTLTAYSPQKGGDRMEGGYASSKAGPDGKFEVRTLADVAAGRSNYITLAGDSSQYGKIYTIPEITFRDASGRDVSLQNVRGVVHDTGSAFKGKGESRFDIPVDRDLPSLSLGSQPFSKQQIAFIPEGGAKADTRVPPVLVDGKSVSGSKVANWEPVEPVSRQGMAGTQSGTTGLRIPASESASAAPQPGTVRAVAFQKDRTFNAQGYGNRLTGEITVNGRKYQFVTGGSKRGSAPFGQYTIGRFTTGSQRAKEGFKFQRNAFELSNAKDDAPGAKNDPERRGLLIHSAARGITAGCIGIVGDERVFAQFTADLNTELANGGTRTLDLGPPSESEIAQGGQNNGRSGLGGPIEQTSGTRPTNTIPSDPQAAPQGEAPVRVADASGRFVPQKTQTWRSTDSQLRDLLIKNLKNFKRMELQAERKQAEKAKETLRVYREKMVTEGFDLMYSGKLTREWLEDSKDILGPEKYGQFLRHFSNTTVRTDPAIYLDLLDRVADEPESVIADARELYLNRSLGKGDFDTIMTKANRQMNPETSLPPWAKELRGMFKEQTAPHGFASLDRLSRAIDARRSWDAYVEKKILEGKLDPIDLKKYTLESITAFRQRRAMETKQSLPIPQAWTQGTADSMTLDEVDAATQRMLQALNVELATAGNDPSARKRIMDKYATDGALLQKWKRTLEDAAIANGEKLPTSKPPATAQPSGAKNDQQQQPQKPAAKPQGETNSGGGDFPEPMRLGRLNKGEQQPPDEQPESRPLGGALGVVPFAENADGSVSLSVPGMILEPWRAFKRGWARMGQVGQMDESGQMYTASDAARDSTDDAITASGMPLAATSFSTAAKALASSATRDVARSIGGSFRDRWKAAQLAWKYSDETVELGPFAKREPGGWVSHDVKRASDPSEAFHTDREGLPDILAPSANTNNASAYQRALEAQAVERGRSPFSVVDNSASMETFFDSAVKIEPGASVSQAQLYEQYVHAAEAQGKPAGSLEDFKRFVAEMGIMPRKTKDGLRYVGIKLDAPEPGVPIPPPLFQGGVPIDATDKGGEKN